MTFPWIEAAVLAGELKLYGCFFDIRSGILERLGEDSTVVQLEVRGPADAVAAALRGVGVRGVSAASRRPAGNNKLAPPSARAERSSLRRSMSEG